MKKERMIKVIGTQSNLDEEENKIELTTEGTFYKKNDNSYIVYDESELSGMEGATTTLKIEDNNKVHMKRFGTSSADFKFEKNRNYETTYMTIHGVLTINVFTKTLGIQIDEETGKGSIKISYDLKITGGIETFNTLEVELM